MLSLGGKSLLFMMYNHFQNNNLVNLAEEIYSSCRMFMRYDHKHSFETVFCLERNRERETETERETEREEEKLTSTIIP